MGNEPNSALSDEAIEAAAAAAAALCRNNNAEPGTPLHQAALADTLALFADASFSPLQRPPSPAPPLLQPSLTHTLQSVPEHSYNSSNSHNSNGSMVEPLSPSSTNSSASSKSGRPRAGLFRRRKTSKKAEVLALAAEKAAAEAAQLAPPVFEEKKDSLTDEALKSPRGSSGIPARTPSSAYVPTKIPGLTSPTAKPTINTANINTVSPSLTTPTARTPTARTPTATSVMANIPAAMSDISVDDSPPKPSPSHLTGVAANSHSFLSTNNYSAPRTEEPRKVRQPSITESESSFATAAGGATDGRDDSFRSADGGAAVAAPTATSANASAEPRRTPAAKANLADEVSEGRRSPPSPSGVPKTPTSTDRATTPAEQSATAPLQLSPIDEKCSESSTSGFPSTINDYASVLGSDSSFRSYAPSPLLSGPEASPMPHGTPATSTTPSVSLSGAQYPYSSPEDSRESMAIRYPAQLAGSPTSTRPKLDAAVVAAVTTTPIPHTGDLSGSSTHTAATPVHRIPATVAYSNSANTPNTNGSVTPASTTVSAANTPNTNGVTTATNGAVAQVAKKEVSTNPSTASTAAVAAAAATLSDLAKRNSPNSNKKSMAKSMNGTLYATSSQARRKQIVDLIRKDMWSPDPSIVLFALHHIQMDALENDKARSLIARSGGLLAIVRAMEMHVGHAKLQVAGCQCLEKLALDHENELAIEQLGGVEAILAAMMGHFENVKVQEAAWAALWNLTCGNADQDLTIDTAGGMHALVSAMKAHMNSPSVQRNACGAIANLCNQNHRRMEALAAADGFGVIAMALQRYWSHPDVRAEASYAMTTLCEGAAGVVATHPNHHPHPHPIPSHGGHHHHHVPSHGSTTSSRLGGMLSSDQQSLASSYFEEELLDDM